MIVIFTYNRPNALSKLLDELEGIDTIKVIDDGSTYPQTPFVQRCEYHRVPHRGKRYFWQNWDFAFKMCKHSEDDRFIFLPDDWHRLDLDRIYGTFDKLEDPFACNVTNVGWQRSWTPIKKHPSDVAGYWKVGWIDHGMITTRSVLEALEWKMNPVSEKHFEKRPSSGTGKQISKRLFNLQIPMYTPYKSMAEYQGIESEMHPDREHKLKPQ